MGCTSLWTDFVASVDILISFLLRTFPALSFEKVEHRPHILHLSLNKSFQEHLQVIEFSILWTTQPCNDFDAVSVLSLKVLLDVVNDYGFLQVSSEDT
jgi:hypothetical protein